METGVSPQQDVQQSMEKLRSMRAKPDRVTEIAAETIDARLLLKVLSDLKKGDFTTRLPSEQTGLTGKIYDALNEVIELNERMAKEFDRVATVVGKEGRIRQRASLPMATGSWSECIDSVNTLIADLVQPTTEVARVIGVAGTWSDLTDNVNFMQNTPANPRVNSAEVNTAVARSDVSKKITVDVKGEILELKNTINTMVDQL